MTDIIFNFELPLEQRVKAIASSGDHSTIKRLISLLTISNSSVIKNTLFHICKFSTDIPCIWRLDAAQALINNEIKYDDETGEHELIETKPIGYEALDYVCFTMHNIKDIPFGCKLDAYITLNNGLPNLKRVYLYMYSFITDPYTSIEFKYKTIRSMVNRRNSPDDEENEISIEMIEYCIAVFLSFSTSHLKYHILMCQLCLTHNPRLSCFTIAEEELIKVSQNIENPINVRADAADMLLSNGCQHSKEVAKGVLDSLSFDIRSSKTVYKNKENVHSETINKTAIETVCIVVEEVDRICGDDSSLTILELGENDLVGLVKTHFQYGSPPIYANAVSEANDVSNIPEEDAIRAYNRIVYLDNAIYTNHRLTLKRIMNYIWTFINMSPLISEKKGDVEKRLVEEMREMYNTCSSGYLVRFANVFTGFLENGGVFIGWDEQILSIFYAKINLAISTSLNRDIILENLIEADEEDKAEFQTLLRTSLPDIIESIREEFKEHIPESDIDIYIRRALSVFEGYGFK